MSKPIPVMAFAFIAFALTSRGHREPLRPRGRIGGVVDPPIADGAEAEGFEAAWRFAPFDRVAFTVCVRAIRIPKGPGFRLLTRADAALVKFEYVWLGDIEERFGGFVGKAREPLGGLDGVLSERHIGFALPNVAHWAFAPIAGAPMRRADRVRSALIADFENPSREPFRPDRPVSPNGGDRSAV